ncbi:MAG TPA: TonB-dependent receptor [Bryobacteraceae bacterium]
MKSIRYLTMWVNAVLLGLALLSFSASAQNSRATVQGLVTDASGAVVPDATVTLANVNTGVNTVRKTSNTGLYVFDLVIPGSYTVTVNATGFPAFTQPSFQVQSGGDVTINATLSTGTLQQSVTVNAEAGAIEFNNSSDSLTLDTKMANDTPRLDRNPFKLTLIEPQAINTRGEVLPYNSWAANSVDLGGGTNLKNELLVDGIPVGIGQKVVAVPNTDDVQESIISTNGVEAQNGHSIGGTIDVTTKSGTNDWHGMAFYVGRYPWLSAESDRTKNVLASTRQNMYGGTFSNPIIKNKLFNFFSIEDWHTNVPGSLTETVPTALEKTGDFSKSLNVNGGLQTVYDPFSTVVNGSTVTRTAFPGNVIPASRFDPSAAALMNNFWAPNSPGSNLTGENNYLGSTPNLTTYYDLTDRVDYAISDKWRLFGRFSRYNTNNSSTNPTPNQSELIQPTGAIRGANQIAADVVYSLNANTVIDVNGDWRNLQDSLRATDIGTAGYAKIWPNNSWYTPYVTASNNIPLLFPSIGVGGDTIGGSGTFWLQQPHGESLSGTLSKQMGSHYLKTGFQWRKIAGITYVNSTSRFNFPAALTASTFNNPPSTQGDGFATMLLGALDNSTEVYGGPAPVPMTSWYGMFVQDTWKISPKLTLTMGLRNEYETAFSDSNHTFSQGLNPVTPIPGIGSPQMPSQVLGLVGSSYSQYTGAWAFTSGQHPGMWNAQKLALAPRLGIAYRLNDKTVVRAGYARYYQPIEFDFAHAPLNGFEDINVLEVPYYGESGNQTALPLQSGIPQQTFSNPFPAGSNPLVPIQGVAGGAATGRGSTAGLLWFDPNSKQPYNDRLNLTIEHEFPGSITVAATYFANFGNQQYNKELNGVNPQIGNQYGTAYLQQSVTNPFYHYQNTPSLIPGNLYGQPTVQLQQLLTKYPLYGPLFEIGVLGASERYQSAELKVQKRFDHGYNFVASYAYIREMTQNFNNSEDEFNNILNWQNGDQPHHHFNLAGTYELPFGRGRTYFANSNRAVDALIGGWQVTGLSTFISGDFPRFNNLNSGASSINPIVTISGNPCVNNPTPQQWFNTSMVPLAANSSAIVPFNVQYGCLQGPSFWDVDASLLKSFNITERVHAQLKVSAYNLFNRLNRGDPALNAQDANYGTNLYQGAPAGTYGAQTATPSNVTGRQMELGLRIFF